jgi:hypothetical protein
MLSPLRTLSRRFAGKTRHPEKASLAPPWIDPARHFIPKIAVVYYG